jgi:hypothetical protein
MTPLEFCEKYLKNYTINLDDTIDVNGSVHLWKKLGKMEKLPVKFEKVSGDFDCEWNKLTTLENCPNYVGGDLWCNILTHHVLGNVKCHIFCDRGRIVI